MLMIVKKMSMATCRFHVRRIGTRTLSSIASAGIPSPRQWQSAPFIVRPSTQEVRNSSLDARNLEHAVRSIHRDGIVVIKDVVPHELLENLNEKMMADARVLQARGKDGPFNYNLGNLQQDAPPVAKYFHPSIFTSKTISIPGFYLNRNNS